MLYEHISFLASLFPFTDVYLTSRGPRWLSVSAILSCALDQVEQLRYFSIMRRTAIIEETLRDLADLPASVQAWDVESGADATGDEAVWVWVTLRDEDLNRQTREQFRSLVRNAVRQRTSDSPPWVYVRFRGASEVAA